MDNLYNRVSRRRQPGQKGFTLIELLVVIAVLAILAAIVIFNVVGVTKRGNASACQTDVKSIQTAMDAYYNDQTPAGWNGQFTQGTYTNSGNQADPYPQFNVLQTGGYLHTNPGNSCDTITVTDQTISAGVVGKQVTGAPA